LRSFRTDTEFRRNNDLEINDIRFREKAFIDKVYEDKTLTNIIGMAFMNYFMGCKEEECFDFVANPRIEVLFQL
jgi:hypothetical protein